MRLAFEAIGTKWQIDIQDRREIDQVEILKKINDRIELFDRAYSRFRPDSLVTKMSKKLGKYILPDDAKPMMELYYDLFGLTGGLVTPLIGKLISDAGYDAEYSLKEGDELRSPPSWDEALEYRHPDLQIKKSVLLDFGALGKGYLIDIIAQLLTENSIRNFVIDAGGDILHRSSTGEKIKIGLENPNDFSEVIGTAEISNESICASAGNRRKWGRFHHIIDPKKLVSPCDILATWVIAETTILSDALTTALFFVPGNQLVPKYNFQYLVLHSDFSIDKSDNFPGELFS